MSINNIQLTPLLLVNLYSNVLVNKNTTVVPGKSQIPSFGKNEKNILIVVKQENAVFLPEEEFSFLSNILTACKINISDVAIINWLRTESITPAKIYNEFQVNKVLLFDLSPLDFGLPMNFPVFQNQKFDKRIYLYAPALSELMIDTSAKKQLWDSLKKLFEL